MARRTEAAARLGMALLGLALTQPAVAQCPMCGQAAANAGTSPGQAYATLVPAVLVLLVPVLGFMGAVGALLWKHRH
jgi:hypothetical protein